MADLYIKRDGNNVIEACPQNLKKGEKVTATQAQIDNIIKDRHDATSDGSTITGTSAGDDAAKKQAADYYMNMKEQAMKNAEANGTTFEEELANLQAQ